MMMDGWQRENYMKTIEQKARKITNADRIRNMTDEELAEYIAETMLSSMRCNECQEPTDENGVCIGECKNEFLRWLQKEVE
jgi:hypothetical protein